MGIAIPTLPLEFAFLSNPYGKWYAEISVLSLKENTPTFTSIQLVWLYHHSTPKIKLQVSARKTFVAFRPSSVGNAFMHSAIHIEPSRNG